MESEIAMTAYFLISNKQQQYRKKTEHLLVASKEKTKYLSMFCNHKAGENHNVKVINKSSESEEQIKDLGTTLTNQKCIHEAITSRVNPRNACYHSVKNLLSSILLSENITIKIYITIIFHVLCDCKTWSLTFREERTLRVFENRVLRRINEPKRDEVIAEWRSLQNEGLHDLYSSLNTTWVIKSRSTRWARYVDSMGEKRGGYRVLLGKSDGKRPLGRPTCRWEDNIKLSEMVGMDWIDLVQDRNSWRALVNAIMNLRVPKNEWNLLTISWRISLSRRTLLRELLITMGKCIHARGKRTYHHLTEHRYMVAYIVILVHLRKLSNF